MLAGHPGLFAPPELHLEPVGEDEQGTVEVIGPVETPILIEYEEGLEQTGSRLAEVERQMIVEALEQHNGVQTRAAESLGISERVLRYKMGKHDIKKG